MLWQYPGYPSLYSATQQKSRFFSNFAYTLIFTYKNRNITYQSDSLPSETYLILSIAFNLAIFDRLYCYVLCT